MNIVTILFTYNRSRHTRQVLEALHKNTILPDKLYIFQDGRKENTDKAEWEAVGDAINAVSWCDTKVVISEKNKGLANSIKAGVGRGFEKYDAVIVLEDDCVPHPQFMEYLIKALEKYESCKEVYHIGASSEPVDVEENGTDAYFMGRINSCGWGTWKDRWEQFCNDYRMLGRIKADEYTYEWFRLWGEDIEGSLLGNIEGTTDSWAAFWALTVIMKRGYCLAPYESLITNIGYDNTGIHSGGSQPVLKLRSHGKISEITLPEKIEFVKNYRKSFACYYPWTNPAVKNAYYKETALDLLEMAQKRISLADDLQKRGVQNIVIWGKGRLADYIIGELKGKVEIEAITETHYTGNEYRGIPMRAWRDLPQDISLIIVIPGFDTERIKNMLVEIDLAGRAVPLDKLTREILYGAEGMTRNEK